jgi:polar amino acid transport system substrate-binding protein
MKLNRLFFAYMALAASVTVAQPAAAKTLTFCSAMTLPPVTFLSPSQTPEGLDVDYGNELAHRLGDDGKWENIAFAGIIPALVAGQCDAIISALYIQPARLKVIDEVPYMYVSQSVLLKSGEPKLAGMDELSGKKVAAVTGSTTVILLDATNKALVKAGKKPIDIVSFPENSAALQQLQLGNVAAFGVQYETASYYSSLQPTQFELGAEPFYKVPVGIGIAKNRTAFEDAVTTQVKAMAADGTTLAMLKKWHLESDALTP